MWGTTHSHSLMHIAPLPRPARPARPDRYSQEIGVSFIMGEKAFLQEPPMFDRVAYPGITFDDVLLEPAFSEVLPAEADVRSQVTRTIRLNIPIISSPMDTVTESELAIALAQEGGLGIIHKNMTIAQQTHEVDKVKRSA